MADESTNSPNPPKKPRRNRFRELQTIEDVKRNLSRCLRALEKGAKDPTALGAMPVDHARALIYGYSKLAELIRAGSADEVLKRLAAIEERQQVAEPPSVQ